jgi:hypothetical protein
MLTVTCDLNLIQRKECIKKHRVTRLHAIKLSISQHMYHSEEMNMLYIQL